MEYDKNDLLNLWYSTGGIYHCPKDSEGKRLGPLVGYAGTYDDNGPKHYVGASYFNFATVEEDSRVLETFAKALVERIRDYQLRVDWVLGAPLGGMALAQRLSDHLGCRYLFAEKRTLALECEGQREKSELFFGRHRPKFGSVGFIVEDTFNNFSTTHQLLRLVAATGATTVCLVGALNWSRRTVYSEGEGPAKIELPVVTVLNIPTPQYRQDDPFVSDSIARGYVIWKPKDQWEKLVEVIETANRIRAFHRD